MVVKDAAGRNLKEGDDILYISRCYYRRTPYLRKGILLRINDYSLVVRGMDQVSDWGKRVVKLTGWKWIGERTNAVQYLNVVKV